MTHKLIFYFLNSIILRKIVGRPLSTDTKQIKNGDNNSRQFNHRMIIVGQRSLLYLIAIYNFISSLLSICPDVRESILISGVPGFGEVAAGRPIDALAPLNTVLNLRISNLPQNLRYSRRCNRCGFN